MRMITNTYLGTQLRKALERSIEWADIQSKEADSMTVAWSQFVPDWRKMLRIYKQDRSKPNPFEEPDYGRFTFLCVHVLN